MTDTVKIKRSGNLLEVTPHMYSVLGSELTYNHRTLTDFGGAQRSKRGVEVRPRELYRIDGNSLYTTQGALQRIQNALTAAHINYEYIDMRAVTQLEPDYDYLKLCMPDLDFRLKQDEVLAHIIAYNSGVIVAPTAYGKTFIMLAVTALYPKANIIIASPSAALLRGTYRRMLKITPEVGRCGAGYKERKRVTLCTFASIMGAPVEKCDILLLDESHRTSAPNISSAISKIRAPVKIFGMTATPTGRSDGSELVTEVMIGPILYRVTYQEAAKGDVVSNIRVLMADVPGAKSISHNYRSRIAKERNCYWRNTARNKAIGKAIDSLSEIECIPEDPQILILAKTVEHAFRIRQFLPDFEVVYSSLSKKKRESLIQAGLLDADYTPLTPRARDNLLRDFEDGKARRVVATGCWGEGVDFVNLDVVLNASGQYSPINTEQWAGRNSRRYEGKSYGIVIDMDDQWDPWTKSRAASRKRVYKSKGWPVEKLQDVLNTIRLQKSIGGPTSDEQAAEGTTGAGPVAASASDDTGGPGQPG